MDTDSNASGLEQTFFRRSVRPLPKWRHTDLNGCPLWSITSETFNFEPGTSSRHWCFGISLHFGTGSGFECCGGVKTGFEGRMCWSINGGVTVGVALAEAGHRALHWCLN